METLKIQWRLPFLPVVPSPRKKIFKMNMPDKIMRRIPKQRGNIPVPAIRKVPMGILKERRTVTAPKRKITIPTMISSFQSIYSKSPMAKRIGHSVFTAPNYDSSLITHHSEL